jgi:Fe-S-cluster containining protein
MKFEITLGLQEAEFRRQIEIAINNARKTETVFPLPLHTETSGIEIMALVLSQINCNNCDARCCKTSQFAEFGIPLLDTEYQTLVERVGKEKLEKINMKLIGGNRYMPTPCPFLHKNQCSIYDIRPFVCIVYPLDQSGVDISGEKMVGLDPFCPEARRIIKRAYLTFWKIFHKMEEVSSQINEIEKSAQQEEILRKLKNI